MEEEEEDDEEDRDGGAMPCAAELPQVLVGCCYMAPLETGTSTWAGAAAEDPGGAAPDWGIARWD